MNLAGKISFWILCLGHKGGNGLSTQNHVNIYFDSSNHRHRDLSYHPEQPARITACIQAIDQWRNKQTKAVRDNVKLVDVAELEESLPHIQITPDNRYVFSPQELEQAKETLKMTHCEDLVLKLEAACSAARHKRVQNNQDPLGHLGTVDSGDTYVTTYTYDVCLRATATWMKAAQDVVSGQTQPCAMALTRPPGHHATFSTSNGFCHFNFCAATMVRFLQDYPTTKVSILDWDVHYGQGVAEIVQKYPRARYVSIHQSPAFPYMGETRKKVGEYQNVLTIPIPVETSWTCGYKHVFQEALNYVREEGVWEPSLIIVCAGYDALDSDELASCSLQAKDFGEMTRLLLQHTCNQTEKPIPILFGLEGGYQLSEFAGGGGLPDAVVETVSAIIASDHCEEIK